MNTPELKDLTPFITITTPIGLLAILADHLVRDDLKLHLARRLSTFLGSFRSPVSLLYYTYVLSISAFVAVLTVATVGFFSDRSKVYWINIGLKSSAQLIVAILLKVVICDYIFALKTCTIVSYIRAILGSLDRNIGLNRITRNSILFLLVAFDISITAMLTKSLLTVGERLQRDHLESRVERLLAPGSTRSAGEGSLRSTTIGPEPRVSPNPKSSDGIFMSSLRDVYEFFDLIDFSVKRAVENALFIMNGATIAYASLLASRVMKLSKGALEATRVSNHIFKILGFQIALAVLAIGFASKIR